MMKIIPHLWYDTEALAAAEWYTSFIQDGKIHWNYTIKDTPSGDAESVEFRLSNLTVAAISAGDYFKLNEAVSFMLKCSTTEEVEKIYSILIEGGRELMPIGAYDFCERYVWLADRFGLNWQIMYVKDQQEKHRLDICLLFDLEQNGKALDALNKYREIFAGTEIKNVSYYDGTQPDKRARINYGELSFGTFKLVAMDHGYGGNAAFNEAFSLMICCETDEEINDYWEKLSYDKASEQCGWVKDEFGISWQIVPTILMELYDTLSEEKLFEINREILKMKKITAESIRKLIDG